MKGNDFFVNQYMYSDFNSTQTMPRKPDLCLYQPDEGGPRKSIDSKRYKSILRLLGEKTITQDFLSEISDVSLKNREVSQLAVDVKPVAKSLCAVKTIELLESDHKQLRIDLFNALCMYDIDIGLKPFLEYSNAADYSLMETMIKAKFSNEDFCDDARLKVMQQYLKEISKHAPEINDLLKCLDSVKHFAASRLLRRYFKIGHEKSITQDCLSKIRGESVKNRESSQLSVDVKPVAKSLCAVKTIELLEPDHKELRPCLFDALCMHSIEVGLKPFSEYGTTADFFLMQTMINAKFSHEDSCEVARLKVMKLYLNEISKLAPEINDLIKCLYSVDLCAASGLLKMYFKID